MAKKADISFSFFQYLRYFYDSNRGKIRNRYKDLTKKFLDFNDTEIRREAYLRRPQFEALEMYVFLKEFMNNRQIYDIFDDWFNRKGDFAENSWYMYDEHGQMSLYDVSSLNYKDIFNYMRKDATAYSNYIFALTMGLGKTVLMATCIFYEFLLSNKYPSDKRYCHNALVFAPDKTVLQSLREIITFDKGKVVPPEYLGVLDANTKFHFLEEAGTSLNTIDGSDFNIVISNTQKIIRKFVHKEKTPLEKLMTMQSERNGDDLLAELYGDLDTIADEAELKTNQRYEKLTRLEQLGVYVDEAHHMFGKDLEKSISSLRQTINDLNTALRQNKTQIVACYNYTGTPYVENSVLPEVVYYYGLKEAIRNTYLKNADVLGYENVKSVEFLKVVIRDFWEKHGGKLYEGLPAKLAIFGATVDEVVNEIKPVVEEVIAELGLPLDKILVNVGESTITKDTDIQRFNNLDVVGTEGSQKQFILLCGKGREGWNCRSLFGVALFRSPKSRIFVLQATMRCLRQITNEQQVATVYLSDENYAILNDELQKNFHVSIKDINPKIEKKKEYAVHILKEKSIKIKIIERNYELIEKQYSSPISFGLDTLDTSKYTTFVREKSSLSDDRAETKTQVEGIKDNITYSPFMIVGELSRYLNIKCTLAQKILDECVDGIDTVAKFVSNYNEVLYDVIMPTVFNALYEVKCDIKTYDKQVPLLRLPEGKPFYTFNALPELVSNVEDAQFAQIANGTKIKDKSFHTDNYCFDSEPERQCFLQYIFSNRVKEVYFTGMFTSQYNGLGIQYIDPETNVIRSYYPDFISTLDDGTIEIIEVKGDNKIDDAVVQAKALAAAEMATVSKMKYIMLPSSKITKERVV